MFRIQGNLTRHFKEYFPNRHMPVRILLAQPASAVSAALFPRVAKPPTFPQVSQVRRSLWSEFRYPLSRGPASSRDHTIEPSADGAYRAAEAIERERPRSDAPRSIVLFATRQKTFRRR